MPGSIPFCVVTGIGRASHLKMNISFPFAPTTAKTTQDVSRPAAIELKHEWSFNE
ncbi:hypothetical protein AWB69_02537 [Caballeronia udeis]|uniref:Uncharacterized protein n=1 Tax=Caballeronia udeis TaxID=1232866 RepID=A0A158GEY0_9BURK|nr:hypothetical protein AWB69_02537 [Caballeronia udeis]